MCRVGCKSLWHAVVAQTNIKCSRQMRLPLTEYRWVHCFTCLPLLPVPAACLTCLLPLLAPSACPNCSCVCVCVVSPRIPALLVHAPQGTFVCNLHTLSLCLFPPLSSPSLFPFLFLSLPPSPPLSGTLICPNPGYSNGFQSARSSKLAAK